MLCSWLLKNLYPNSPPLCVCVCVCVCVHVCVFKNQLLLCMLAGIHMPSFMIVGIACANRLTVNSSSLSLS